MSSRPGFFSLLAESQLRKEKDTTRRSSVRETQKKTVPRNAPNLERAGSNPRIGSDGGIRNSNSTLPPSNLQSESINLARSPLGSSSAWKSSPSDSRVPCKGLSDAAEGAAALCKRLLGDQNYLWYQNSAESVWEELCTARWQLATLLDSVASPDEQLLFKATSSLADIYVQLGDYDMAQSLSLSLCPSLPLTRAGFTKLRERHRVDALLHHLQLSTYTGRDLGQAEMTVRVLPWASPDVLQTANYKSTTLLILARSLNGMGRHVDAYDALEIYEATCPPSQVRDAGYHLQKAIAAAGRGLRADAEASFVAAFVIASSFGAFHPQTLNALYEFGRALKAWGQHEAALNLLTICVKGWYYKSGTSHPRSVEAIDEVISCEGSEIALQDLRRFGHCRYSRTKKWIWAYEQNYLTTAVEVVKSVATIDYVRLSKSLKTRLKISDMPKRVEFNMRRNLAWVAFEQHKLDVTSTALYDLYAFISGIATDIVGTGAYHAMLAGDEAICSAKSGDTGMEFMRQRSKLAYLALDRIPKERKHQVKAMISRLASYGLTHFTHEDVFSDPPLVAETNRKKLGTGAVATVDVVQVGTALYARKAISLPRRREQQARPREGIQTELKIMRALDHPHTVRVLLTYEESNQFSIIMHPLADSDLENYLAGNTCDTARKRHLMQTWVACLTNTLAFIHSRDVRHKDIKPRNVLVKGEKVYFADFGSGHMFSDSGNSTTDGPAFGHTRAYCAPEVIKNENRSRSSDVFSLGCVLAEMTAWISGISMQDYFDGIRADKGNTDTVRYHDSINRVKQWFETEPKLTERSKQIYSGVVRHMVRKYPVNRRTAVQSSHAIGKILTDHGCVKCGIDLWVPGSVAEQE